MTPPPFNVVLNVAQVLILGGLIWGLARMSKSVDILSSVTDKLTTKLEFFGSVLNDMVGRVRNLESRKR